MGQVNCETTSEPTPAVISPLTLSPLSLTHNQSDLKCQNSVREGLYIYLHATLKIHVIETL